MNVTACNHCGGYKGARSAALRCNCKEITLSSPVPLIPEDLRLVPEDDGHDPYNSHRDIGYRVRQRSRRSPR